MCGCRVYAFYAMSLPDTRGPSAHEWRPWVVASSCTYTKTATERRRACTLSPSVEFAGPVESRRPGRDGSLILQQAHGYG